MKKTAWILIILLIIVAIFAFYRKDNKVVGDNIKIGIAVGLTGYAANWGEGETKAIALAYDEYKDRLPNVEFITENTKSDGLGTVNAIKKLVEIDKVQAIIGPTWGDSFQGGYPIATQAQVPVITPSAAFESLEKGSRTSFMFSTWWPQAKEAKTIIDHMKASGVKKIAILHDQDAFNTSFGDLFKSVAEQETQNTLVSERIVVPVGTTDFRTNIAKIGAFKPDTLLVLLQDTSAVGPLMKQLKEQNVKIAVYSTTSAENEDNIKKFPGLFNGLVYSFPAYSEDAAYQKIKEAFVKKYGTGVVEGPAFVNAYNAAKALFEALLIGIQSGQELSQAIQSLKTTGIGVSELSFDQGGQIQNANFKMKKIENDSFIDLN